jgi:hypothetical protein
LGNILEEFCAAIVRRYNIASIAKRVRHTRSKGGRALLKDGNGRAETKRQDPLRRFTSTPHATVLRLMQRSLRLETNNPAVLAFALKFFERHQHGKIGQPEFLWRIVCESDPRVRSTAVQPTAFSDQGLRYLNIGQRGFLALDLDRREAMGFLADVFLEGKPGPRHPPLDILVCMTASSLGLTVLSGGCVSIQDHAVMIFGPPNSGKTTACYLAAKLGMEFQADQAVFLDMSGGLLHAWGDLQPAVFRPEALDFLPELRQASRRSAYADVSFHSLDKSHFQAPWASPVVPVCSLFLERGRTSEPRLREIPREEALARLRDCMLFNEDARFDAQSSAVLTGLAARPVYNLQYGDDPQVAVTFIERMLR